MTAVVQPVIKHERQGQVGPAPGLVARACLGIDSWQQAMWAGVVR